MSPGIAVRLHSNPPPKDTRPERVRLLPDEWTVAFVPTMDNSHGDFRLPVTGDNKVIGRMVLDASFSFDGVIGAFALTQNLFLIAIGLGIGAMSIAVVVGI